MSNIYKDSEEKLAMPSEYHAITTMHHAEFSVILVHVNILEQQASRIHISGFMQRYRNEQQCMSKVKLLDTILVC